MDIKCYKKLDAKGNFKRKHIQGNMWFGVCIIFVDLLHVMSRMMTFTRYNRVIFSLGF